MTKKKSLRQENPHLYQVWAQMRYRCDTPTCQRYERYGGRGITYCEEWNTFNQFCEWSMNNGYKKGLSLDRIDNNGNYEPSNCRWIPIEEQLINREYCYDIVINGEKRPLKEWCKIYDIKYHTVISRIKTGGWDEVRAVTTPIKFVGGKRKKDV